MTRQGPSAGLAAITKWLYGQAYILLTLTILFWSGNLIVGRAVHQDIPPIGLAFWRWLVGFLFIFTIARLHLLKDWSRAQSHLPVMLVLAALGIGAFNTLLHIGLGATTAINGALLQSTMPLMIVAMSFLFFGERVTGRQAMGLVVSLTGVLTIVLQGDWRLLMALSLNRGDL